MKRLFGIVFFALCVINISIVAVGPKKEKPLVVVSCMYNNAEWVEIMLDSVFRQNYSNFRVILTDDGSTDGTAEIIQAYIDRHGLSDRIILLVNKERRRKLANLYRVLYRCDDMEIAVMVDGDDKLADNEDIFSFINDLYDDHDIWFTYGQYRNEPATEAREWGFSPRGFAQPVPARCV